ncbi:hypothetical protein Tco_0978372 [Tanacetum coccineum]|uniref:Uncharacterized protein n=1 Tax=Tanacetum coccineum TaxID=301880 RepID=A0ABQ5EMV6_9ASTR
MVINEIKNIRDSGTIQTAGKATTVDSAGARCSTSSSTPHPSTPMSARIVGRIHHGILLSRPARSDSGMTSQVSSRMNVCLMGRHGNSGDGGASGQVSNGIAQGFEKQWVGFASHTSSVKGSAMKDNSIPLRDIIARYSPSVAITSSPPDLPTEEPEDFLIMGDEHLDTILEKESDELIKSSVENLVPIPSDRHLLRPPPEPPDVEICFDFEPDTGVVTTKVVKGISEHYVHLCLIFCPLLSPLIRFGLHQSSHDSPTATRIVGSRIFKEVQSEKLLSWDEFFISFIHDHLSPVFDTLIPFSSKNEDKVFNPGILISPLLSHRGKIISNFYKTDE